MTKTIQRVRLGGALLAALLTLAACGRSPEEKANDYFKRGGEFAAKGDDVRARIEFRNAVQYNNNMLSAWKALATIEEKSKNWGAVYNASKRISEIDEKDVNSRLLLARLSFTSRKLDEALKFATEATELEPKNPSALALRAAVMLRLGDNKGAIQEANKVLAIDPKNIEAVIVLASEKFVRGDAKGALSDINELPPQGQDDLGAIVLKIRLFEYLKDAPGIEKELKRLVELHPSEAGFKQELVKFYISQKRPDEAVNLVRTLSAADANNTQAGLELVRIVGGVRGVDAAREELSKLIAQSKNKTAYEVALAELEFSQNKFDEAANILNGIIKADPKGANGNSARAKLAEMYLARRDPATAVKFADEALATDSRDAGALRTRASAKIELGQLEGAMDDIRTALNDQPRSPELLSLFGVAYERNGQIELADKQYADAMRFSEFKPAFGLNYVNFLNRRGQQAQLDGVFSELAARNPTDPTVLAPFAQYKISRGDLTGAQELAERIKKLGGQGTATEIQAAILSSEKKFDASISILQEVQAANPNAGRPAAAIISTYLEAKQPEKAEQFIQSLLKANPNNADAYVMMGITKVAQNQSVEAIQNFEKAVSIQPKSVFAYRALSDELIRTGKLDQAVAVLDKGLAEVQGNFELRQFKASLLEFRGNIDAAIKLYDELLKEQPGSMVIANNLASLISDHRSDKESLDRAFAVAVALNKSQVPQFKDTLGWLYHLRGDSKAALPLLEQASQQLPNMAVVRYHLGVVYNTLGEPKKAAEQLKKAAELEASESALKKKIEAALQTANKAGG